MRIAVISDFHAASDSALAEPRTVLAIHLVRRAVQRFNRYIRPDYVLVLGDLVADPAELGLLGELREILDQLTCPYLVIPGNHDPAPEQFFEIMSRPGDRVDFGDVRFLSFIDPEEPGACARRPADGLARLRAARDDGFTGTVIALQHVPLMPEGSVDTPFHCVNRDDVMAAMETGRVDLAIGGHVHIGTGLIEGTGRARYQLIGALGDAPHPYHLITVDGAELCSDMELLGVPAGYGIIDQHSHTQYAYCSDDMDMALSPQLAATLGLRGIVFTEHSGQLYVSRYEYWAGGFCADGVDGLDPARSRMADYRRDAAEHAGATVAVGVEVDADFSGRPVLHDADRAGLQLIVGAVHFLRAAQASPVDPVAFESEFRTITECICRSGIQVLAHPFRLYHRAGVPIPGALFSWLAGVLRDNRVAAEINFHTNEPSPAFFQICLEQGVKISLGSDAHGLWEVGEFYGHLRLLSELGVTSDLGEVLYRAF